MTDPETPEPEEPKIIIDDDWKEQVAKEKAAATSGEPEPPSESETPAETAAADIDSQPPPPASFDVLVTMLFTQAMATLGHLPNPATGKSEVNKPYAKHYIDTLEMLGEKTAGNLSEDETKMLADALHALRLAYVDAKPS